MQPARRGPGREGRHRRCRILRRGRRSRARRGRPRHHDLRHPRSHRRQLPHRARRGRRRRAGAPLWTPHLPHRQRTGLGVHHHPWRHGAVQPQGQDHRRRSGLFAARQPDDHQRTLRDRARARRGQGHSSPNGPTPPSASRPTSKNRPSSSSAASSTRRSSPGTPASSGASTPRQLPASILKRLPVRFNYDDSYFNHPHQAMPRNGYTEIVESILDHPAITVHLSSALDPTAARAEYDHVIWTGPLDAWFDHRLGRLGYRTLDFERIDADGDFQGCSVMNYGDVEVPYTRISEHKHFAPWESHDRTVAFREFSRSCERRRHSLLPDPTGRRQGPAAPVPRPGPSRVRRHLRRPPRHLPVPRHGRDHRRSTRCRRRHPRRARRRRCDPVVLRRPLLTPGAMRTIVHIGQHKTGSTALQSVLFADRARLAEHGILYPDVGHVHRRDDRVAPSHNGLFLRLNDQSGRGIHESLDEMATRLADQVARTRPSVVLISSERGFMLPDQRGVEALARLDAMLPGPKEVVAYLRRPDRFAASYHRQLIRQAAPSVQAAARPDRLRGAPDDLPARLSANGASLRGRLRTRHTVRLRHHRRHHHPLLPNRPRARPTRNRTGQDQPQPPAGTHQPRAQPPPHHRLTRRTRPAQPARPRRARTSRPPRTRQPAPTTRLVHTPRHRARPSRRARPLLHRSRRHGRRR